MYISRALLYDAQLIKTWIIYHLHIYTQISTLLCKVLTFELVYDYLPYVSYFICHNINLTLCLIKTGLTT